jgi:tetratricopeptide (TPR) repeat protein
MSAASISSWSLCVRRCSLALLALALLSLAGHVRTYAQGRTMNPDEGLRQLMQDRMEQSQRAVQETERRRFEDHKDDNSFPSDARATAKPGIVRALTPEQRQALAHTDKGLNYFAQHKFEQALKEYDEAIKLDPKLAAAYNNMGSAYFALTRFTEAANAFKQATELDPKYGQAHLNLALALLKLGREREARAAYAEAFRAYVATGDEEFQASHYKEAEASYQALLQIDPDYAPAHLRLGLLYNVAGRYNEATEAFQHVIKSEPQNADAHEGLAESYYGQHKYTQALEAITRALKLHPQAASAHYLAGLAYLALDNPVQAQTEYNQLKTLHADDYAQRLADAIAKKTSSKP